MIPQNRQLFLSELRSGKYQKGTIKSDERGRPIIETPEDEQGHCACAIMVHLFGINPEGKSSMPMVRKALGLRIQDCTYIQQELNDSPLTFDEIADRIEEEIFNR
jgi:hypothetical protein